MSANIDPKLLNQQWVHSHEEDTTGKMVFRPAAYPFPPSRGRMGFDLHADSSLVDHFPGPGDAPQSRDRTWTLDAGKRILHFFEQGKEAPTQSWEIDSAQPDKLILKK